jgi:hypothetical protein
MGSRTGDGPRSTRDTIHSNCPSTGSRCLSICCLRLRPPKQWPCSRVARFGDHVVAFVPIYRWAPGGGPRPHCSRTDPPNRRERGRYGYGRPRPRLHPLSRGCAYHHILDRCFWWPYRLTGCHWQSAGPLADTVTPLAEILCYRATRSLKRPKKTQPTKAHARPLLMWELAARPRASCEVSCPKRVYGLPSRNRS